MTQPRYGITFNRKSDDPRPAVATDMSTIFLIGTSEDAVSALFPLNTPVLMNSSDTTKLAGLGTGDLATAVQLINAQLGPFQVAARIAVCRVSKGASADETIDNIIGSQAASTGIYAALQVGPLYGIIPRLFVIAGGYTGRFTRAPAGKTVTEEARFGGNVGNGLLTLASPAHGNAAVAGVYRVRLKTPNANGGVFSVVDPQGNVLDDAVVGTPYTGQVIKFAIADGTDDFAVGDGFDVTVTVSTGLASVNPICAALPQVLNNLLAHALVDGPGNTKEDAVDWRETLSSDRLIPVDAHVAPVGANDGVFFGGSPVAAGIGVAVDYGNGGIPSRSFANQAVQGITALKRYDAFSITDGANDGQELLTANVGIIQRGELGVESAATSSGFVLIATDNAGTDELFRFYNVTRMRDYMHLGLLKLWRQRLGKTNITRHGVQAVENDAITFLGSLKAGEHIIDFRVGVNGQANTPESIRAGILAVYFRAEEASPLLLITADSFRYRDALGTLVADITGETNQVLTTAAV